MSTQARMTELFKAVVAREVERTGKEADAYRAVAAKAELGYDYVYQIYKSKGGKQPKQPSVDAMSALSRAYADDEGFSDLFASVPSYMSQAPTETEYLPGFDKLHIPLLAQAASMGAGEDAFTEDIVIGRLTVSPHWAVNTLKPSALENLRFIHGYGDSMRGTFEDGDILLVDVGVASPQVDGVYVLEANKRLYIKRVRQRLDGTYEVTSDNPAVKTIDILDGRAEVLIHGRVIWCWNGKKM